MIGTAGWASGLGLGGHRQNTGLDGGAMSAYPSHDLTRSLAVGLALLPNIL